MRSLEAFRLGRVGYDSARTLMEGLAEERARGERPDTLLLLEHEPVYTLGRRGSVADIRIDAAANGIEVAHTDRGGLVTYHGPGQLVGYPILDLGTAASAPAYVATLEAVLIEVLASVGIDTRTIPGLRGVFAGEDKIAAIGVHLSNGITTHGFALNLDPDLEHFDGIVPCGITDHGVTSIARLRSDPPSVGALADACATTLARALDATLRWPAPLEVAHA